MIVKDEIMDLIQNGIKLLLSSGRPSLIVSAEGVSPLVFQADGDDIWIATLSELQDI